MHLCVDPKGRPRCGLGQFQFDLRCLLIIFWMCREHDALGHLTASTTMVLHGVQERGFAMGYGQKCLVGDGGIEFVDQSAHNGRDGMWIVFARMLATAIAPDWTMPRPTGQVFVLDNNHCRRRLFLGGPQVLPGPVQFWHRLSRSLNDANPRGRGDERLIAFRNVFSDIWFTEGGMWLDDAKAAQPQEILQCTKTQYSARAAGATQGVAFAIAEMFTLRPRLSDKAGCAHGRTEVNSLVFLGASGAVSPPSWKVGW